MYREEPNEFTAGIVVLHEVWGLEPHTKDVCRRLGELGYAAVAPDLYWREKGLLTPANIRKAMEGVWDLSLEERRDQIKVRAAIARKKFSAETLQAVSLLYSEQFRRRLVSDALLTVEKAHAKYHRVSALGFCLGGGLAFRVAARSRHLRSTTSFYGEPPSRSEISKISAPILAIHATHDEIINTKVPAFVEDVIATGKDLTLKVYPHTRHGFFNDANRLVYNKRAAAEAWELTKWFFERTLG